MLSKLNLSALVIVASLLVACGASNEDQLSTAVAKLETQNAAAFTETSLPSLSETPVEETQSALATYYVTEFETRFAALEGSYASFTLLYNIAKEDPSIMSDRTWTENVNAALDTLAEDANYLARIFPFPDELLELNQLTGALDTGTYFFALSYRDAISSLDPAVMQDASARYEGIRTHMDEVLALFQQLTGQ